MAKFYRIRAIIKDTANEDLELWLRLVVPCRRNLLQNSTAGGRHLQLVQRAIKTIVPLWRQFHADADADRISSTVLSPAYMYIENERIIYSSHM